MDFFARLADVVESRWSAAGRREEAFAEIAAQALEDCEPHRSLDPYAALTWLLGTSTLPRQRNIDDPFGRPAIQVHEGNGFYVEVFHWFDGTTEIHQHGFSGAFHVLAGSSIHALYDFESHQHHGPNLSQGQVIVRRVELLRCGDTRQIVAGRSMIHSLFHLARPSVSVVVRTLATTASPPQYSYWRPGLAINPRHLPELIQRQAQALEALAASLHPSWEALFQSAGRVADAPGLVHLTMAVAGAGITRKRLAAVLDSMRDRHGDLVDGVLAAVVERGRQRALVSLRTRIHEPEHRFFLALMLTLGGAREIVAMVRASYAGEDPAELILRWIREITGLLPPGDPARALFDLFAAPALQGLLKDLLGASGTELAPALPEGAQVARRAFRGSLLGPLFC